MEKKLFNYCVLGFVFVSVVGTLTHFTYEWSGGNYIVGLFCPISEAVFQHTKMILFPAAFFSIILYIKLGSSFNKVLPSILLANLIGVASLPVIFYTFTGMTGSEVIAFDIVSFYFEVFLVFFLTYKFTLSKNIKLNSKVLVTITIIVCVATIGLSELSPNIPYFNLDAPPMF